MAGAMPWAIIADRAEFPARMDEVYLAGSIIVVAGL